MAQSSFVYRCLTGLMVGTVSALFLHAGLYLAGIRLNVATTSAPLGVYQQSQGPYALFCPGAELARLANRYRSFGTCPDRKQPLLKLALGKPGDVIDYSPAGIALNGSLIPNTAPLAEDSHGRQLPHYPFGHYREESARLWLISRNPKGFDSRYFGPVARANVSMWMRPLWTL